MFRLADCGIKNYTTLVQPRRQTFSQYTTLKCHFTSALFLKCSYYGEGAVHSFTCAAPAGSAHGGLKRVSDPCELLPHGCWEPNAGPLSK